MTTSPPCIFTNREWMRNHLNAIKIKAGSRYSPKLHVELPVVDIFEGISRTPKFYQDIRQHYGQLVRGFRYLSRYKIENLRELEAIFEEKIRSVLNLLKDIEEYNTTQIAWDGINRQCEKVQELISKLVGELSKYKENLKHRKERNYLLQREGINANIYYLLKVQEEIQYFIKLASSTKGRLSNYPFLLLTGEAGIGKTHLLCDIVQNRALYGLPSILVFGEFFKKGSDIWQQIIGQLNLTSNINSKEIFLNLLNKVGEYSKCRSLLIIDALNEATPQNLWKKKLKRIMNEIKKYPNVALVISIRKGFEEEVLTDEIKDQFIIEEHQGFAFKEWEAVKKFFSEFSLPLPEIPLLTPEFQNPLFLLLFCKAFQKRECGNKQIFRGHEGFTYIFENYIDSVAKTIEDEFGIQHSPKKNLWDTIIKEIAEEMVRLYKYRIPEKKLKKIIKKNHPNIVIAKFINSLDRNLLLTKVPVYSKDFKKVRGYDYRFPFQKFSDHLIIRYLLKKCKAENKQPEEFFKENSPLTKLIERDYGLIGALSIQCPEWFNGKELVEIAPYLKSSLHSYDAFIESIIWRKPESFSKRTIEMVSYLVKEKTIESVSKENKAYGDYFVYPKFTYKLLDALLNVSSVLSHPLNANFLHTHLLEFSMPERDAWWSTFLHYQHEKRDAVERIIEWVWSDYDKYHIKDKSILLLSTALTWFLTTSNRYIRDKSTKTLVALLQYRIHLIPEILEKFKDVNDAYILERLFAVAYGCVLRNQEDLKNLEKLALWTYNKIFKDKEPPIHILLRDYARGIIEVALRRGIKLEIKEKKIDPPYKSNWPECIPSDDEIKKYMLDYKSKGFKDYFWSQDLIISSMQPENTTIMGGSYGDFGRYIFQSALSRWDTKEITVQQLSNLAVKKIFSDIGYDIELHGRFDRNLQKHIYSREAHKSERIGKKYQWIAFHEILALVSDYFSLQKDPRNEGHEVYKGPWQLHIRDIDPSLLIKNDNHIKESLFLKKWFSTNGSYNVGERERENICWLKEEEDLPNSVNIINIMDDNGLKWLMLEGFVRWEEETPTEYNKYEIPIRELLYMLKSYIVKKEDINKILEWAEGRSSWGREMPESNKFYEIFLGEYPNSIAFKDLSSYYNALVKKGELPASVVVTYDSFSNEFTYDGSCDQAFSIKIPCKWLVNKLQLNHKYIDGRWFDTKGELIVLATKIFEEQSLSALLIKKGFLKQFLEENGYTIFWILQGEKGLIGGNLAFQNYQGHLLINGIYIIDYNNNIIGRVNAKFEK